MAYSLNKIMLIGRLGKDAETRFASNNNAVTSFGLATDHSYKGKDGNWVNETTWHNIVVWNQSDAMRDALKKGKLFYVEGRLVKREYTDKDGNKRNTTEVNADKLIPLSPKEGGEHMGGDYSNNNYTQQRMPETETTSGLPPAADENQDLPF